MDCNEGRVLKTRCRTHRPPESIHFGFRRVERTVEQKHVHARLANRQRFRLLFVDCS